MLVEEGYSWRDAVVTRLGISHKTVFRIVHKHRQTGSVGDKPRSGRPKSTTPRQDRILIRKSLGNRRLTAPELRAQMEEDSIENCPPPILFGRSEGLCGGQETIVAGCDRSQALGFRP